MSYDKHLRLLPDISKLTKLPKPQYNAETEELEQHLDSLPEAADAFDYEDAWEDNMLEGMP